MSLASLMKNKTRSFLSVLGITIAIAAVIAMQGLGNGAQTLIEDNIKGLSNNLITIRSQSGFSGFPTPSGFTDMKRESMAKSNINSPLAESVVGTKTVGTTPLTKEEFEYLKEELPKKYNDIKEIGAVINDKFQMELDGEKIEITGNAVTVNYFSIQELEFTDGNGNYSENENQVVLGYDLGDSVKNSLKLSNLSELIGREIEISNKLYRIIGVLNKSDSILLSSLSTNLFVSLNTYLNNNPDSNSFSSILISTMTAEKLNESKEVITNALRDFRNLPVDVKNNFIVSTALDLASTITQVTDTFVLLLTGISAISLLVGGIGISNIMLVSVTERTKEIGLRKAIGAKRSHILLQFLLEAMFLTLIGGIFGIIFGYILAVGVGSAVGLNSSITIQTIILATSISSIVGILFGFLPAYNASKLSAVDALRYE